MQPPTTATAAEVWAFTDPERAAHILHTIATACGNRKLFWSEAITAEQVGAAVALAFVQNGTRPDHVLGELLKEFYKLQFCTTDHLVSRLANGVPEVWVDPV